MGALPIIYYCRAIPGLPLDCRTSSLNCFAYLPSEREYKLSSSPSQASRLLPSNEYKVDICFWVLILATPQCNPEGIPSILPPLYRNDHDLLIFRSLQLHVFVLCINDTCPLSSTIFLNKRSATYCGFCDGPAVYRLYILHARLF